VIDIPASGNAEALVGHRVDRVLSQVVVVDHRAAGRHLTGRPRHAAVRAATGRIVRIVDAEVGRCVAREGGRNVVDVTAAPLVVDHSAHRQGVGDHRQVEYGREFGIGVTTGGHAVTCGNARLRHVELRLVRDVTDDA